MRHTVGPDGDAVDVGDALVLEGFDVGHIEHVRRDDRGDVLVTHGSALEPGAGPVPAPGNRFPTLLVAAPAIKAGRVLRVRIERLDRGYIAVGDLGHRLMQPGDGRAN